MHFAICDDNLDALAHMVALLAEYRSQRKNGITYETFFNALDLLNAMKTRPFDLLLLDIVMTGFSGMEAAKEIRSSDKTVPIVFLTASREFAVESYRVRAEDYILKPVQADALFPVLDRLLARMSQGDAFLTLKSKDSLVRLPLSEIVYVEVINRRACFTLISGETLEAYGALSDFEKDLALDERFFKPHRSYIVNLRHMTTLNKTGFVTATGITLPVSRDLFVETKTAYMKSLLLSDGRECCVG